jgi:uncharacterized LabA/DUF88 family protein
MPNYLPFSPPRHSKYMVFVDGENLAIRYKNVLTNGGIEPPSHVSYEPDVFAWSQIANQRNHKECALVRSYYYTCTKGDDNKISEFASTLKEVGITDPRVFKKNSNGRSKRVDITLATEMLLHAYKNNYDIAVLVAGDDDYVPLVQEIK